MLTSNARLSPHLRAAADIVARSGDWHDHSPIAAAIALAQVRTMPVPLAVRVVGSNRRARAGSVPFLQRWQAPPGHIRESLVASRCAAHALLFRCVAASFCL